MTERRLLHGTYEQGAELVAQYAKEGVGRMYIQHFSPLDEIDAAGVERHLKGISG